MPADTLGKRIALRRKLRHLSQAELAEKTGLSPATISALERDVHTPRSDHLITLSDVLRVPARWLMTGKTN